MKTVYKYPIKITDEQYISIHRGAKILHAGIDPDGATCLWALVDPKADIVTMRVLIVGTGSPIQEWNSVRHVGSFTDGPFVWHVFTT